MVQSGQIDGAFFDGGNPMTGPGGPLALDWGPGSQHAAQGDQRWFAGTSFGMGYIALNPTRPVFKDPDVRQAVSLALDRQALAGIWVDTPAAGLLPSSVSGSDPDGVVQPPDLVAARALMKGQTLAVTLLGGVWPFFASARVGCGFVQPAIGGVDLLSLCIKDPATPTSSPSSSP